MGKYDDAIRQFQIAINLKQDYANAYYNLGHALEEKGEYAQALSAYNIVKQLVADNKDNVAKIDEDIANLNKRQQGDEQANQGQQPTASQSATPANNAQETEEQIDVNRPQTTLRQQTHLQAKQNNHNQLTKHNRHCEKELTKQSGTLIRHSCEGRNPANLMSLRALNFWIPDHVRDDAKSSIDYRV